MRHVLEHFMNPIESLIKISAHLSNNGIIYIAVPNMMNPKGSLTNSWFRTVHTFYLSRTTLSSIASIANLQPIEIKSENHELWAVFKKTTDLTHNPNKTSVFNKQMKIIRTHHRKILLKNANHRIIKTISIFFPRETRSLIKNNIKKFYDYIHQR